MKQRATKCGFLDIMFVVWKVYDSLPATPPNLSDFPCDLFQTGLKKYTTNLWVQCLFVCDENISEEEISAVQTAF